MNTMGLGKVYYCGLLFYTAVVSVVIDVEREDLENFFDERTEQDKEPNDRPIIGREYSI